MLFFLLSIAVFKVYENLLVFVIFFDIVKVLLYLLYLVVLLLNKVIIFLVFF